MLRILGIDPGPSRQSLSATGLGLKSHFVARPQQEELSDRIWQGDRADKVRKRYGQEGSEDVSYRPSMRFFSPTREPAGVPGRSRSREKPGTPDQRTVPLGRPR